MRYERLRHGYIKHRFEMPFSRLMGDAARSRICQSRSCSTPLTSSLIRTSRLGQPVVSNGLPLTKIHHAAFDADLIGIDPDFRVHVSDRLLEIHDGPFLELGLKGIVGNVIDCRDGVRIVLTRPTVTPVRAIQEVGVAVFTIVSATKP